MLIMLFLSCGTPVLHLGDCQFLKIIPMDPEIDLLCHVPPCFHDAYEVPYTMGVEDLWTLALEGIKKNAPRHLRDSMER